MELDLWTYHFYSIFVFQCQEQCPYGLYGLDCEHECGCINGGTCNPIDGSCSCPDGWKGLHCDQVWPLTQFFLFPFSGKHYSLQFLPATPSSPSRTLEELFEADQTPFKGPRLASCVASGTSEIQGHRQVCRPRCGGPRTPSTTTDANLNCLYTDP